VDGLDVSYLAAVAGGLLSFFSPCVLPLVLPFLAWCGGVDLAAGGSGAPPGRRRWLHTLAFVAGFVSMFVALGATATVIGRGLAAYQQQLGVVAGAVLVVLGLHVAGVLRVPWLDRVARLPDAGRARGLLSAYVIGLSFAFGWSPCIGPLLAAILTLAGTRESVAHGMGLLGAYAAAMAAPFFVAAFFADRFQRLVRASARLVPVIRWSSAALIVATGVAIMTGTFWYAGFWMLWLLPASTALTR